jgi:hypothetical protein
MRKRQLVQRSKKIKKPQGFVVWLTDAGNVKARAFRLSQKNLVEIDIY